MVSSTTYDIPTDYLLIIYHALFWKHILRTHTLSTINSAKVAATDSPLPAVRAEAGNLSLGKSVSMRLVLFCVHFEQYTGVASSLRIPLSRKPKSAGNPSCIMHHMAKILLSFQKWGRVETRHCFEIGREGGMSHSDLRSRGRGVMPSGIGFL